MKMNKLFDFFPVKFYKRELYCARINDTTFESFQNLDTEMYLALETLTSKIDSWYLLMNEY